MNLDIEATEFFKALGEPTRLKLVLLLRERETACVCDLIDATALPQPTVSRHLNHLQRIGILIKERKGTWMWYGINPNIPIWCQKTIDLIENKAPIYDA